MTAATNYADLQTSLKNLLHRADLDSVLPEFIQLGEARLNRRLRARSMIATVTINPSQVNKYDSLPAGFNELISLVDDLGENLIEVDYDELADLSYSSSADRPTFFAIGDRIDWERVSGSVYNYTMRYFKNLDIATDSTNTVISTHPDAYLYAAALAAQPYLKDDSRLPVWAELLGSIIKEINAKERKNKKKLRTDMVSNQSFNVVRGY